MNSPRMKRFGQFLLVIFALVCVLMTAAFAEGDVEHTSFVWGTVASLLPPVAAIVLALITKEVYTSLLAGIIAVFVPGHYRGLLPVYQRQPH